MTPAQLFAYLARIGLHQAPPATREGLAAVLTAHRQSITFENLDIPLGRGIAIDSASVFDKLVTRRRGGYCFEQNGLFSEALAALGMANRPLLGRVRLGLPEGQVPPRTHVLLLVDVAGGPWIADAGFGGAFVPPLPLRHGAAGDTADGASHRLTRHEGGDPLAGEWLVERAGPSTDGRSRGEGWQAQYSFDLSHVAPADVEQANPWTSTRPGTRFTSLCVVSRVLPAGFATLTGRSFSLRAGDRREARELAGAEELGEVLREVFALELDGAELDRLAQFNAG